MDKPTHFYADIDIDRDTLYRHVQTDLDRGAIVCIHFHKRNQPCGDGCEVREPEVEHRNIFDQA